MIKSSYARHHRADQYDERRRFWRCFMNRVVEAIFKDGVVQPLEPLDLPDEARLTIIIGQEGAPDVEAGARQHDPLATIYELAADAGPADLSVNLDHYLYGLPKKQ